MSPLKESSTFSFPDRNIYAIDTLLNSLPKDEFPIKLIVCAGAGAMEPFITASHPLARDAQIFAVDNNKEICDIGEALTRGEAISYDKLADVSHFPGVPNHDLLKLSKRRRALQTLSNLGCLENLGPGCNQNTFHVGENVRNRVHYICADVLEALDENSNLRGASLIIESLLAVNIRKVDNNGNRTRRLVSLALRNLDDRGIYLVSDTAEHLDETLDNFSSSSTVGNLNLVNLAHLRHFMRESPHRPFSFFYYLVGSKLEVFPNIEQITQLVQDRIRSYDSGIDKTTMTMQELAAELRLGINFNLAYIVNAAWNVSNEFVSKLVPNPGDERSIKLFLPGHLNKSVSSVL